MLSLSPRFRPPPIEIVSGVKGEVEWELQDPDGSIIVSSPKQPNMILNSGLDALNTNSNTVFWTGSNYSVWYYGAFRAVLAVGTGSTEPAPTQTTLVNEVARSNAASGFDGASGEITQGSSFTYANGTITVVSRHIRTYTFTSNLNLTEYGFSPTLTAGSTLSIRELFRDGNGVATPISGQSGQLLKMTHTFTLTIPVSVDGPTLIPVTGLGDFQMRHGFYVSNAADISSFVTTVLNAGTTSFGGRYLTAADSLSATTALPTNAAAGSITWQTYTTGSYGRARRLLLDVADANTTLYGLVYASTSTGTGYKIVFNNPQTIVKDNTKKLTFDVKFTYGRAA